MITKIKAAYVVGFDGVGHEIITNGEVVYENDTILYVGCTQKPEPVRRIF